MAAPLDHLKYYRLPWNYADNGISWLEPTTACNLRCEGCYRDPSGPGHKTLDEVRADLEVFKRLRKSDCMSIAGGDPLVYPQIVELVRMIREMGWKPIVNTNGLALDESLLGELKEAGVFGFTFHIDTSQKRPDTRATTEDELNELRLHFAEMLAQAGGIACSFNATVSEKTVHEVPSMVNWAQHHADIVHTMVFILYRSPSLALMAADVVEKIREADPRYEPAAYLNGTAKPDSLKWLLADRIVLDGEIMGYVSPRFMELVQTLNHLFTGTYLAYAAPRSIARGKLASFFGGIVDTTMRTIFFKILGRSFTNPQSLLRPAHLQSIMIIQPVNFESDGRQDMCDSCPDITIHEGRLVWSCRLEEMNNYGVFLQSVPRKSPAE
jgi:pyruvate-formate lyase-activating enzyme